MDQAVLPLPFRRVGANTVQELGQPRFDRNRIERGGWARIDMDDAHVRREFDVGRQVGRGATREDIDFALARAELRGQLRDVDVHAAGFGRAGTREGRGVGTDEGEAADGIHGGNRT